MAREKLAAVLLGMHTHSGQHCLAGFGVPCNSLPPPAPYHPARYAVANAVSDWAASSVSGVRPADAAPGSVDWYLYGDGLVPSGDRALRSLRVAVWLAAALMCGWLRCGQAGGAGVAAPLS